MIRIFVIAVFAAVLPVAALPVAAGEAPFPNEDVVAMMRADAAPASTPEAEDVARRYFIQLGETLAEFVAESATYGVLTEDPTLLDQIVASARVGKARPTDIAGVIAVRILDGKGVVLVGTGPALLNYPPGLPKELTHLDTQTADGRRVTLFRAPVFSREDVVGCVDVVMQERIGSH
jgi:hypothetical protein